MIVKYSNFARNDALFALCRMGLTAIKERRGERETQELCHIATCG